MTLPLLVRRNLRRHALSTTVSALAVALAGALLMTVWTVREQAGGTFARTDAGFNAVLGARGARLQLVLNAVFHLESSPGNLQWQDYLDVRQQPGVEFAVPLALGDNYRGWRLVGTTRELFERAEYAPGRHHELTPGGDWFDPQRFEAVVGALAARGLGFKVGDTFQPFHGLTFDPNSQHPDTFTVVGILKPSNTPADRVIWVPLAAIQNLSGHDPQAATEVSAVLVKLADDAALDGFALDRLYNRQGNRLTFAWPISAVVADLFNRFAWLERVLAAVAGLVALVAAGTILASIYNSLNERRRELAILRALGARRRIVFAMILLEATAIAGLGAALALVGHFTLMTLVAARVQAETGVTLDPVAFSPVLAWAPVLFVALGALAGLLPAIKAYRTPVAETLSAHH